MATPLYSGTGVGDSRRETSVCPAEKPYIDESGYRIDLQPATKSIAISTTDYHAGTMTVTKDGLVDLLKKIIDKKDIKGIVAKLKK